MWPWEKETRLEQTEMNNEANRTKLRTWRGRHRDKNRENCHDFRVKNPDYQREWREQNPDKVKEYSLRQNDTQERRDYMREYMKEYRKKHKTEKPGPRNKGGRPKKKIDV